MTRCNISEFEKLYMRFNYSQRYLQYADQEILNDKQFKRSIRYVVNLYTRRDRMRDMMLRAGFEADDLLSIATMFGLVFNGRQTKLGEDPKNFLNMIRFVSQRMQKFCDWVVKKFSIDDAITFRISEYRSDGQKTSGAVDSNSLGEEYSLGSAVEADSLLAKHQEVCQDIEDMRQEFDQFEEATAGDARSEARGKQRMLTATKFLRGERARLAKELRERRKEQRNTSSKLRTELYSDPDKYKEELCRYATYKTVASDVRRAARLTCGKLGIDYRAWAIAQINSGKAEGYQIAY